MDIAILTSLPFNVSGGAERHVVDTASALNADIVRITPKTLLKHLNYDFYVPMDDIARTYLIHNVPHLYYTTTPRRALYDMTYISKHNLALAPARKIDQWFVKKYVKNLACISHTVRTRICKYYLRDSYVIYPPVHTEKYIYKPAENYWLSVNRVDKWKRVPLQVKTFRSMPDQRLVIVGKVYPQYTYLSAPNVTFLGEIPEPNLIQLYSKCIGLITTAIDEDFGLTPLEAMASGKPVVCTKEGGYLETVLPTCGKLVHPNKEELQSAILEVSNNPEQYREPCINRAKEFDYPVFKSRIVNLVGSLSD